MSDETRAVVRDWLLIEILADAGLDDLPDDLDLQDNGILDSLSTLRLVDFLEERFDIEVDVDEAGRQNFGSIARLVRYVERKTGTATGHAGRPRTEGES